MDHRAQPYKTETLNTGTRWWTKIQPAQWLNWDIPARVQQKLLERRALGTQLATLTPEGKRRSLRTSRADGNRKAKEEDPYAESLCPVCARRPDVRGKTHEAMESMEHFIFECPHLEEERNAVQTALRRQWEEVTNATQVQGHQVAPWAEVTQTDQLGMLMGNITQAMEDSLLKDQDRYQWLASLQCQIQTNMAALWNRRQALIKDTYPHLT